MKNYHTNCVNSTAELIDEMCDSARAITANTFIKHIGIVNWNQISEDLGYRKEWGDLRLSNDYAVSFFKSKYKGMECVYVEHSSIEHIFV